MTRSVSSWIGFHWLPVRFSLLFSYISPQTLRDFSRADSSSRVPIFCVFNLSALPRRGPVFLGFVYLIRSRFLPLPYVHHEISCLFLSSAPFSFVLSSFLFLSTFALFSFPNLFSFFSTSASLSFPDLLNWSLFLSCAFSRLLQDSLVVAALHLSPHCSVYVR